MSVVTFYTLMNSRVVENHVSIGCASPPGEGWSVVRVGPLSIGFRQRHAASEAPAATIPTSRITEFSLN